MIDWQQVLALKEEIGDDDFDEVVDMFLGEVEEGLGDLRDDQHSSQLEASLHALKSSALNLGFRRFADPCAAGEGAEERGEPVDLAPIFATYAESKAIFVSSRP